MMELSVMSGVSSIFAWVVQYINGGLLNVLFTVSYNETTNAPMYTFEVDTSRLVNYGKSLLLMSGKSLPLDVLKSFPSSIGGGEEGVKMAKEHPNREAVFMIGPLVVAVIMLIAIIGMIIISCCTFAKSCCCCCCHKRRREQTRAQSPRSVALGDENTQHVPGDTQGLKYSDNGGNGQMFDNGYDGYAFYYAYDVGSDSSSLASGFQYEESLTDSDGNPKGFRQNLRGLFLFYSTSVFGSRMKEEEERVLEEMEEKLDHLVEKSEFVSRHQNCFCYACHVLSLVLVTAYVIGLIVCVVIYLMAAQQVVDVVGAPPKDPEVLKAQVVAWLDGTSTHYNLPGTISYILKEVLSILDGTVNSFFDSVNTTLAGLGEELKPTVVSNATNIFTELQSATQMDKIFVDTNTTYDRLYLLYENLLIAKNNYSVVDVIESDIVPKFTEVRNKIDECNNGNSGLDQGQLSLLDLDFTKANVTNPTFADQMKTVVDQFLLIRNQLIDLKNQIDNMPEEMANNITANLNFTSKIDEMKAQIDANLEQVRPTINDLSEKAPEMIGKARPFVGPVFFALGGLMALMCLIFLACLLLLVAECCYRKLYSFSGKGPSRIAEAMNYKRRSHICGGCRLLVCSILMILLVVLALLAAVILALSSLFEAELCPYVHEPQGVQQSDFVVTSMMATNWPPVSDPLVDMPVPKNVLYALTNVCTPIDGSQPMLLPSVGVDKLANLTKVVEDDKFTEQLNTLINKMAEEIPQQVPDDIIKQISDMKDYVAGLKTLFEIMKPDAAVGELKKVTEKNEEDLNKIAELLMAKCPDAADALNVAIQSLKDNKEMALGLQNAYKAIADQKDFPDAFASYIDLATEVLVNFKDSAKLNVTLNKDIRPLVEDTLIYLLNDCTTTTNGLVNEVLPCGGMHYIYKAVISTGCADSGLFPRLFGWALALLLSTLFSFLSFLGLFNLWCIQNHQIRRFYGS